MTTIDKLHSAITEIENIYKFHYPTSFKFALHNDSLNLRSDAFSKNMHLLLSIKDISDIKNIICADLIPFMVNVDNDSFSIATDEIYCFELSNKINSNHRVVVWSVHTTVAEWDDFDNFISWFNQLRTKY